MILLIKDVNKLVNKPEESNLGMVIRRRDRDYIRKVIRMMYLNLILALRK